MLSTIQDWIHMITHDDMLCLAQADAQTFKMWEMEETDPNLAETVKTLVAFVNKCPHLRKRDDYKALLEGLATTDDTDHLTAA